MEWIRNLYEKVKPFIGIILIGLLIAIGIGTIRNARGINEYRATTERIVDSLVETRGYLGEVISGLSDLEAGHDEVIGTVRDLQRISSDIVITVNAIEERSLAIGDTSTESGIVADRLYRVNRELAERLRESPID